MLEDVGLVEKIKMANEEEFAKLVKSSTRDELVTAITDAGIPVLVVPKMNKNDIAMALVKWLETNTYPAATDGQEGTPPTPKNTEGPENTEPTVEEMLAGMTVEDLNPDVKIHLHKLKLLNDVYNQVPKYINPYLCAIQLPQVGVIALCNGAPVFIPGASITNNGKGNLIGRM